MKWYEADICIDNLGDCDKPILELLRFNGYVTAQVNSRKKLKPSELFKFQWEIEEEEQEKIQQQIENTEPPKPITKQEAEAFAAHMREMFG